MVDEIRQQLQPFAKKQLYFQNTNFNKLPQEMNLVDQHKFNCDFKDYNVEEMYDNARKGWALCKKYKLKEDISEANIEKARKRMKMLQVREVALNVFMYALISLSFYFIYRMLSYSYSVVFN